MAIIIKGDMYKGIHMEKGNINGKMALYTRDNLLKDIDMVEVL